MFKLILQDRLGNPLSIGDIVKISDGRHFKFYSEVKYLENEQVITPFHTFSFHSFEKVDKLPDNAKLLNEERYKIWYIQNSESDDNADENNRYLLDWRNCEHLLDRCYKIELL